MTREIVHINREVETYEVICQEGENPHSIGQNISINQFIAYKLARTMDNDNIVIVADKKSKKKIVGRSTTVIVK